MQAKYKQKKIKFKAQKYGKTKGELKVLYTVLATCSACLTAIA